MKNVKYIFIGDSKTLKKVGDYPPSNIKEEWKKDIVPIFERYCQSTVDKRPHERSRIVGSDGNYYFTLSPQGIFYLVLADSSFPERHVFELIEQVQRENVTLMLDNKGELSKIGTNSLKILFDRYENQNSNKVAQVQADINDVKIEMKTNIQKVIQNVENTKQMETQAIRIKDNAAIFKQEANALKKETCCQNCKWTIIITVIVIGILLVIILPLTLKK
jgi:hypothetical protein